MSGFEWEKGRGDRPPAWQSSQGKMWERSPVERKEGKDHLTGYEPHEKEEGARPREAARMGGSFGDVSVGVSRKGELTLVVSKRRSQEGPPATREEKTLVGASARTMNLARGDFRVNAHDPNKSAVAYRESDRKPPTFLLERFKEMMRGREQDTLEEQAPFLNREKEKRELEWLRREKEALLAGAGRGKAPALGHLEARKETLRQRLAEKSRQERRLLLLLQKAREKSRRRGEEGERAVWRPFAPEEEDLLPPPEGGEGGEDPRERQAAELLAAALGETEELSQEEEEEMEK